MRDNAAKIKPEDKARYEAQQVIVKQIIGIFESPNYSDEDPAQGVKVVGLMNEVRLILDTALSAMGTECVYIFSNSLTDASTWLAAGGDHGPPPART